jgi:hypothetical protein
MSYNNSCYRPMCGLHGVNVVVSTYNQNGMCRCINCNPRACQSCARYKEILQELDRTNKQKLERCVECMRQK